MAAYDIEDVEALITEIEGYHDGLDVCVNVTKRLGNNGALTVILTGPNGEEGGWFTVTVTPGSK